jgi:glycosyltransferase involved in cell wall biosynthesis
MSKKVLLFTLQTFSTTGGIQKMTRTLGHALSTIAENDNWAFNMYSAYDADSDLMPQYLPAANFKGFNRNRVEFSLKAIRKGMQSDIVILSHINLALVGLMIKKLNPNCKIWLVAHGIEVWRPLSLWKRALLKNCEKIICVSNFTKQQMIRLHNVSDSTCVVLNNAIDPFMHLPTSFAKPQHLLNKYNLTVNSPVIFTLTRLAATEQYKGHEQVINIIGKLKMKLPGIKYILAGQYDSDEELRIRELIAVNNVEQQVILTGFLDEKDLPDHFLLADIFVLPSKKEGFGIVFIEALACGLPVVCGNADGSIDAIRNGELGVAINVEDLDQLELAIDQGLKKPLTAEKRQNLQQQCLLHFNEKDYIINLKKLFTS